jgi:hypothetical protein
MSSSFKTLEYSDDFHDYKILHKNCATSDYNTVIKAVDGGKPYLIYQGTDGEVDALVEILTEDGPRRSTKEEVALFVTFAKTTTP